MARISLVSGGRTVDGVLEAYDKETDSYKAPSSFQPPAARGDDFAENVYEASQQTGSTPSQTFYNYTGAPQSVISNANIIERVVPLLDSQANLLQTPSSDDSLNFENESPGSSFEEILGIKKKKKKELTGFELAASENPLVAAQFQLLDKMQKSQDAATRDAIRRTRQAYNAREAEMQQVNERGLAQVKQALNLSGSSRYAPISSSGIITMKEQQGIKALSALDAEENRLISEIKTAQAESDYRTMEQKLGILETVRQEKAAAAKQLETDVMEGDKQSTRDNAIAGLVSQGITNPIEMLNALNFDEQGNQIGDFTIKEVTESLKALNEFGGPKLGFDFGNKEIGQFLGLGFTTQDIKAIQNDLASGASLDEILSGFDPETQEQVKSIFGVTPEIDAMTVNVGKGAQTELDEKLIRSRLFSKLSGILNKGTLSDTDRETINKAITDFRDGGMGEQEILDTLAGLPSEVSTPYNSMLRDTIVANSDTLEKQNQQMSKLAQLLNSGKYETAMKTVEDLAMTNARKLDPENFMGSGSAQYALKTSKDLKKLIADAEDILGPLEGTLERVKNKIAKSRDPRATAIAAKITALTAPMRNQLSGTAVTASETSFLEPLIPSLSDTVLNINEKISALETQALDRYNTTRQSVGLPMASIEQVIDPKKRLILYSNDVYLPTNNQLDI
jgi:hypothetical protein